MAQVTTWNAQCLTSALIAVHPRSLSADIMLGCTQSMPTCFTMPWTFTQTSGQVMVVENGQSSWA